MHSDLEMSGISSQALLNEENSCCESESDIQISKTKKNRRRRKNSRSLQQHRDPAAMNGVNTDDDTESQINFEETPVNSTAYSNPVTVEYQDKMRRRLQFFFMNPIEKWQAKRR